MPLFRKILYSTDFSPLAEYALDFVKKLKEAGAEEVVVVHVVDSRTTGLPEGVNLLEKKTELLFELPEDESRSFRNLIEKVRNLEAELRKAGFKVHLFVTASSGVADVILDVAKKEEVKLIVLGAHGKPLIEELILGSVSHDIVKKAECPVLLIKKG